MIRNDLRTTTTEIAGAIPPPPQIDDDKRGLTLRKGGGRASERELSRIVLGAGMVSEWSRGRCVLLLSRAISHGATWCRLLSFSPRRLDAIWLPLPGK